MKINLTIDVDFLNEDETLEDGFREEIKNLISQKVVDGATKMLINEIKPSLDKHFKGSIEKTMEDLLSDYLNKPVVISDGYKAEKYDSALEMVRIKFSSLYDAKFRDQNSCNNDPLMKKLKDSIEWEVKNTLSRVSTIIQSEAKKIANEEINKNALLQALHQINKD